MFSPWWSYSIYAWQTTKLINYSLLKRLAVCSEISLFISVGVPWWACRQVLSREWKREGVMDEQSGESKEEAVMGEGIGKSDMYFLSTDYDRRRRQTPASITNLALYSMCRRASNKHKAKPCTTCRPDHTVGPWIHGKWIIWHACLLPTFCWYTVHLTIE